MSHYNLSIDEIDEKIANSPFKRSRYTVTLRLKSSIKSILNYTHADGTHIELNKVFEAVPNFQRDNDKWNSDMKSSFIQNLLMGCKTDLFLYEVGDKGMVDCKILDGLQRITAIYGFLNNEVLAFGKTFDELKASHVLIGFRDAVFNLHVFRFDSEREAIQYYIDINENITHSQEDIARAKYFLSLQ